MGTRRRRTVSGWNQWPFDVATNKNVDFLVADIAADKSENKNSYAHTGVPTLFRHKLSMVNVAANLAEDYANKKFILNSVKFTNLCHYATYSQIPEKMIPGGNRFCLIRFMRRMLASRLRVEG